jgi:hypothetical protein
MRTHQLVLSALVLLAAACAAPRPTPAPATSPTNLSPQPSATVSSSPATVRDPNPAISIAAGITPRLTAAEVAELAVDRIHSMERTVGQVVKPPRVLAIRATGVEGGIEWRVDAEGTFTSGRPRVSPPPVAKHGEAAHVVKHAEGAATGDARLTFGDGCVLELWPDHRSGVEGNGPFEHWRFFRVGGPEHFVMTVSGIEP